MSQKNTEIVRRLYEIWSEGVAKGDMRSARAAFDEGLLSPDSTFTPLADVPGAGARTYIGAEGLRDFVREWIQNWTDWDVRLEDVVYADDDRAVAVLHQSAAGRTSGAAVRLRFVEVLTFRGGQIVDRHDYRDARAAFEALGLTE